MEDERQQRWAISESEEARIEELKSSDELIGTWTDSDGEGRALGDAWSVVVLRDGTVTNRTDDGTVGVPDDIRDLVGDEETLYHPGADGEPSEETLRWVDVVVSPEGDFLRLADEPSAAPGM